jgi:hypothetical protein
MVDDDSQRRGSSRRTLLASTLAAGGVAGCLDRAEQTSGTRNRPGTTVGQRSGPTTIGRGQPSVVVTTDGTSVTATGTEGVIAEGDDAGAVLQAVFDTVTLRDQPGGRSFERGETPPGRHVHFGRGTFPWRSQAETTGANGIQITGEWYGTDWSAESEIESFLRFTNPAEWRGHHVGPTVRGFQYHGKGNAKHGIVVHAHTDDSTFESIVGYGTKESMIYAQPVGEREFYDNAYFRNLRAIGAGAVAILEDGPGGVPADVKFERCACNDPNTYGLIFRNSHRIEVDRFYAGLKKEQAGGVVLLENPQIDPEFGKQSHTQSCWFHMIELEDNRGEYLAEEPKDGAAVHIRTPDTATTYNRQHRITFPRARQLGRERFLKVEGSYRDDEALTRDITLEGLQEPAVHDTAVELVDVADCHVQIETRPDSTNELAGRFEESTPLEVREFVSEQNCRRTTVNGVGRNAGDPRRSGHWNGSGYEGAKVLDTENDTVYEYVDGSWRA